MKGTGVRAIFRQDDELNFMEPYLTFPPDIVEHHLEGYIYENSASKAARTVCRSWHSAIKLSTIKLTKKRLQSPHLHDILKKTRGVVCYALSAADLVNVVKMIQDITNITSFHTLREMGPMCTNVPESNPRRPSLSFFLDFSI